MPDLIITVQTEHVPRVRSAFNNAAGKSCYISVNNENIFFDISEKQVGETDLQYGQRVLRELGRNYMRASELNTDRDRYKTDLETITPPGEDVPADIFTSSKK